ncbi:MAG: exosortase A, partial [Woeseiaceae bacterium]|nr:exosortase A [Woeseiaceae bacterium]
MNSIPEMKSRMQDSIAKKSLFYNLAALSVVLITVSVLYFDTFRSMVAIWLRSDTFLHGIIIFPISFYLVWRKWPQLRSISPKPFIPGLFLLVGVSIAWFVADALGIQVGTQLAATAIIPCAILTVTGVSFVRAIAFPLAYLFFAVPFGEFWVPDLMEITADFAIGLLRLTGIPVLRDGLFLSIPSGNFVVAEACSGIRYLLAAMALGTLYAYLNYEKTYKRLIFIAFSFFLPIIANGFRAYGIIAIAYYSDMKYAVGVDHLIYGWIFFGVVIGLMFLAGSYYRDDHPADNEAVISDFGEGRLVQPGRRLALVVLAAIAAASFGPLAGHAAASRLEKEPELLNGLPNSVA